jgi:hypothetical protein
MGEEKEKKQKKTLTCYCEHTFEVEIPEYIDLEATPEIEEHILNGSFMTFTCTHCGKILKPEFPVHIVDAQRGIDIFMIPEAERQRYLSGKHEHPQTGRIVIGYRELVEKFVLMKHELDDRVIEIIKMYLLKKAGGNEGVTAYFHTLEDDKLVFHIHGLKKDEVGVVKVPRTFYQSTASELEAELEKEERDEDIEEIVKEPYVSVNKLYIGEV